MCGISAIAGDNWSEADLARMVARQRHRGPDGAAVYVSPRRRAGLGHNRLKILDLSVAGRQPMSTPDGRYWVSFNGEVYNYLEIRESLDDTAFRSRTDTEVVLAAYARWGAACLDRFIGMFALAIWDEHEQRLFVARDRYGVKPVLYHQKPDGTLLVASEVKALHAAGVCARPDAVAWATYLSRGWSDYSDRTFWTGIHSLPAGHALEWHDGAVTVSRWYDLPSRVAGTPDDRPAGEVEEEYLALLHDAVRLRFRSDVPVGITLSGGVDSSALVGLVGHHAPALTAFTFVTGDPTYDELPSARRLLRHTSHRSVACRLDPADVPRLAEATHAMQDEPFGGVPTLAYARLFEEARSSGVIVLLEGSGLDEQWAGYDYYRDVTSGQHRSVVQGSADRPVRPECLSREFRGLADPFQAPRPFADPVRNLQLRDTCFTKLPRALRFNDRASMAASVELREPFLDHRLFELALRQPADRKVADGSTKVLMRRIAKRLAPADVVTAPKRPVQTPQREWLRGPLRGWAGDLIDRALAKQPDWFDQREVDDAWRAYCRGESDTSFYVWQWISVALAAGEPAPLSAAAFPIASLTGSGTAVARRGETCELA